MNKLFKPILLSFILTVTLSLITLGKEDIKPVINTDIIKESTELNKVDILVNKYNYLKEDYVPENLERINNEYSSKTIYLVKEAKDNFIKMCDQAKKENLSIRAISGYRDYNYQKALYNSYTQKDKENVDKYSAKPGYSEHQTGLAVDVDNIKTNYESFESTKAFKWMKKNSYKYGFILRYPKGKESITGYNYESWHYRYVGKKIAKILKEKNMTLEEYKKNNNY